MRTWGATLVALALGAVGAAACGSEASLAPDAGVTPEAGAADAAGDARTLTFDFTHDWPVWQDGYPENTQRVVAFVQNACEVLDACAPKQPWSTLEAVGTVDAVAGTRGQVVARAPDGRLARLRGTADSDARTDAGIARPTISLEPFPEGVVRVRRMAEGDGWLECLADGACVARFAELDASGAPLVQDVPAALGAVDALRIGGETWVAGRELYVRGLGDATFRPVPGVGRPLAAITAVSLHLLAVGAGGFATWVHRASRSIRPLHVEGAPDFVDVAPRGPGAWMARTSDGRVVFGVNEHTRVCALASPVVDAYGWVATADGVVRVVDPIWGTDLRMACDRYDFGRPYDFRGSYICGHEGNSLVVSRGQVLAWEPVCFRERP